MPSPTEMTEPGLGDIDRPFVILDLLAQDTGNFVRSNLSHNSFRYLSPAGAQQGRRRLTR